MCCLAGFPDDPGDIIKARHSILRSIQYNGLLFDHLRGVNPEFDEAGAQFRDQITKRFTLCGVTMRFIDAGQDIIPQFRGGFRRTALVHFIRKRGIHFTHRAKATDAHALTVDGKRITNDALSRIAFNLCIRHIICCVG